MKIAIGSDHRGFEAKRRLMAALGRNKHEFCDVGCHEVVNVDYPDIAASAARKVATGDCEIAILLEGSGIGMTIVANIVPGVRAVHAHDEFTARRSREHHHCNVLCIGADLLSEEQIRTIADIFLSTPCEPGKHARRIDKIKQIENTPV